MIIDILSKEEGDSLHKKLDDILKMLEELEFEKKSNQIYSNEQLAIRFEVSKKTIKSWRDKGLIGFTKIGRKIFYNQEQVADFLKDFNNKAF
jgi:hypothetical protein